MIKLEENEKIIKVVRKHWIAILFEIFFSILMAVMPLVFYFIFKDVLFVGLTIHSAYLLLFLYTIFTAFIWIFMFISWVNYYLDIWIITNKRLVDVEQRSLFSRNSSDLRLDRIQDITIEVVGLVYTLLKVGNIRVQTASTKNAFIIQQAENPEHVKQIILDAYSANEEKAKIVKIQA